MWHIIGAKDSLKQLVCLGLILSIQNRFHPHSRCIDGCFISFHIDIYRTFGKYVMIRDYADPTKESLCLTHIELSSSAYITKQGIT